MSLHHGNKVLYNTGCVGRAPHVRKILQGEGFERRVGNAFTASIEDLPSSLKAALLELKNDSIIRDTLGPHVYTQYVAGKEKEWLEYKTRVSSWELSKYLVKY